MPPILLKRNDLQCETNKKQQTVFVHENFYNNSH